MTNVQPGISREVDVLTASTLKHLRERWWSGEFTDFLRETLQPRAGDRILDVGCGAGTAEVRLGQLGISQMRLFGVDLIPTRVANAVAGAPAATVWDERRAVFDGALARVTDGTLRKLGDEYLAAFEAYKAAAIAAGSAFVEIQSTTLFATVGQKV